MDLTIVAIGRLKGAEAELCSRYLTRINAMARALGIGKCTIIEINEARASSAAERKQREAQALLKKISDKAVVIALDEHGKLMNSQKFAARVAQRRDNGASQMVFVLGGADGHGDELLARADLKLSLSALTMPHGLARAVLAEQLYRALTILANHPYHRQ